MLEKGISLCIQYYYPTEGELRASLYRVADYDKGIFNIIDPWSFTDAVNGFNPRFIRIKPDEEVSAYIPVIRRWNVVPHKYDSDRNTTESFADRDIQFYEIIFNTELIGQDDYTVAQLLKEGIQIPDCTADNFLLAIAEDRSTYYVLECQKNHFRKYGDVYRFEGKIEDRIHARHKLNVYVINKTDVISTADFGYFYTAENNPAPTRFFYGFEKLPEKDGFLYLYSLNDYIPIFVNRYLKTTSKKAQLTKSEQRRVIDILREALAYSDELNDYFSKAGYEKEALVADLQRKEDTVIQYFLGSDNLDYALAEILKNSTELSEKYVSIAKQQWLEENDEDRDKAEQALLGLQAQHTSIQKQITDAETYLKAKTNEVDQLEEAILSLKTQEEEIVNNINKVLSDFDKTVSRRLVNNVLLRETTGGLIQNNDDSLISHSLQKGYTVLWPDENASTERVVRETSKAYKILENNLKHMGISSDFGQILARIVYLPNPSFRTMAVNGLYARAFANAISCAIDGVNALQISIHSSDIDYEDLYKTVSTSKGKVVLIENLLDFYNELTLISLNKDFPELLFVVGVENEKCFNMLSGNIWNYILYVNADVVYRDTGDFVFITAHCDDVSGIKQYNYDDDLNEVLFSKLSNFPFSILAKQRFCRLLAYFDSCEPTIDTNVFVDSIIAKYSLLYADLLNEEELDTIRQGLSPVIKEYYRW